MQTCTSCHHLRSNPFTTALALPYCLLLTCLSLYFNPAMLHAADEKTPANGDDWLTFYYRNPRPNHLIAQLKAWSEEGTLQDSNARAPLLGFLSQVFHQNPQQLQDWYQQTQALPAKDQELVTMALWMCNSEESKALLKKEMPKAFAGKKPPNILQLKLDSPSTLDLLWGYYFATGESKALRRIIEMFRYADAPQKLEGIPEGRTPLYTTLPHAAKWSLSSNAKQHPKVLQDCKKLLISDQLNATEKKWLDESLQQAKSPQP